MRKVKIKTWDEMEKEFGLDTGGSINCKYLFNQTMEEEIPKDRIIAIDEKNKWGIFDISEDMIKKEITPKKSKTNNKWKKPKLMYRGMCPSDERYPNELCIVWDKGYFEEKYKPAGWKIAPNKMIESMKIKKQTKKTTDKIVKLKAKLEKSEQKLAIANKTVCKQMEVIKNQRETIVGYIEHIEILDQKLSAANKTIKEKEEHLRIAENAIERKDKQFLGLRCAYQDEIINKG